MTREAQAHCKAAWCIGKGSGLLSCSEMRAAARTERPPMQRQELGNTGTAPGGSAKKTSASIDACGGSSGLQRAHKTERSSVSR